MNKRIFLTLSLLILLVLSASAVLKEKDLDNTLSILRHELTTYHLEQEKRMLSAKEKNENIRNNIFSILAKSNQNALMLYSQKREYVFDLAYACHEATEQFRLFKTSAMPFRSYMTKLDSEILRYDSLTNALKIMPVMTLSESAKVDRNVCLTLATNISKTLKETKQTLGEYIYYYDLTEQRLKGLNDYANVRYNEIQNNIFNDGGSNYFSIISDLSEHLTETAETVNEKYKSPKRLKSQWDSRMMLGLFVVIFFYGVVAIALNVLLLRYLLPKRFRTEGFLKKRTCIILTTTVITFAIILGIVHNSTSQNFIAMASNLLVEYAWLLGVILFSLLLRVDAEQLKSAFRIYSPLIFIGFIVIAFRIVLIPNDLVNLIFPPLLLACTLWQWSVMRRHNDRIPRNDMIYAYISQTIFIASLVCSWSGFTLMSVQILIWWIMQLTCILTIRCVKEWINDYAARRKMKDLPLIKSWRYHLLLDVVVPLMGCCSVLVSLWWAANVFNLSELMMRIFSTRFINEDNFSVSLLAVIIIISLFFIFKYISNLMISMLKAHFEQANLKTAASRTVMGKNVVQIVIWGTWLLVSIGILHVNSTWIVVISGGLSTGVGFASKDILENLYYGVSLMTGRIKIGDWIECDGTRGKVSSISYTSTMIEAIDGSVIAFQNSQLFTKNYKNLTRNHGYELSIVPFGVAYGNDIRQIAAMVEKAVTDLKHPWMDKKKPVKVVFTEFGDNSINFKVLCWVNVIKQIYVESDIMECIYNVLQKNNIEIPFPQRDVHIIGSSC